MTDLRKQLEALRDEWRHGKFATDVGEAFARGAADRLDTILAEQGEQSPELSAANVLAWMESRHGASWAATIKDVRQAMDALTSSPAPSPGKWYRWECRYGHITTAMHQTTCWCGSTVTTRKGEAPSPDDADYKETRNEAMKAMFDTADLPAPSPAPDAGLREKVAKRLAAFDGHAGDEEEEKYTCEADAILRLRGEGQYPTQWAYEQACKALEKHRMAEGQLREAVKPFAEMNPPDAYFAAEYITCGGKGWIGGTHVPWQAVLDARAALQRTPEPPSREMERKAFVVGWRACLDALADKHARGHQGVEAEAARRYGGET